MNIYEQLKRDEGEVLHAYQDSLGFWTIGIGVLIDKRKGGGITEEESQYLFQNRLKAKTEELEKRLPWFKTLDPIRQAALQNMAYQLGVPGLLKFTNSLAAIRDERYAHAEALLLQSLWAKQTPNRARRIARQIATGEWQ